MDRTNRRKKGGALRAIWLCAFALTVLAVLTAPLALSRYVGAGTGASGTARVAKWDVAFADRRRCVTGGVAFTDRDIGGTGNAQWQEVGVINTGEVVAEFRIWVGYVEAGTTARYATDTAITAATGKVPANIIRFEQLGQGDLNNEEVNYGYGASTDLRPTPSDLGGGLWRIGILAPGERAWVMMRFNNNGFDGYPNMASPSGYKCKLFIEAIQVD